MKLCSWNCRGLGGSSTISQLKEVLRNHLPNMFFLCETKKKRSFVQTVCRKLKYRIRNIIVDPVGLSGGLLVCWFAGILIKQIVTNSICIEDEYEDLSIVHNCWAIFVYANPDKHLLREQWAYLLQ